MIIVCFDYICRVKCIKYLLLFSKLTHSFDWTQLHIESLKQSCIAHVEFNQPIPEDIVRLATAPLPEEWFNITDDTNITDVLAIQPQPTILTPGTTKQSVFNVDLLLSLRDIGCSNDCSGNGECRKGITPNKCTVILSPFP